MNWQKLIGFQFEFVAIENCVFEDTQVDCQENKASYPQLKKCILTIELQLKRKIKPQCLSKK